MKSNNRMKRFISLLGLFIAQFAFTGCLSEQKKALEKLSSPLPAEVQFALGWCYYEGYGVEKDPREAVKWYRKAAEQGHATAQVGLGWCYYEGGGVEKDPREAVKWYRKAAEQGDAKAQKALSQLQ